MVLSPYWSNETLPVTPSTSTLPTASIVAWRAELASCALASEVFRPSMIAFAAS